MAENPTQRRLAAILVADVVGYSRLMEQDEAATLALLKSRRRDVIEPLVAQLQGRVFKSTGDGVLVEFGSAVNAVQCAVDLQERMAAANSGQPDGRQIVLRIGVNLGDVMVEGNDLFGDGINIAARLEGLAQPGGILISGTAYDYVRNKVKVDFEDLGAQSVKNIAEPVRTYRIVGMVAFPTNVTRNITEKLSIAVLPFANMSSDPEQEYFSDGMTEEIITALSHVKWFFVIARNSSFTYKGKAVDIRRVGRELGVRYVLEGSVRKAGKRLRITGQLIDADTGRHVWAEKYDGDCDDVFELQDRVAIAVARAIEPSLRNAEIERVRSKPVDTFTCYDFYLRALPMVRSFSRSDNDKAIELIERALQISPTYAC